MIFPILTKNNPYEIVVEIESKGPTNCKIVGFNSIIPSNKYFDREVPVNGKVRIHLGCPCSPSLMMVKVTSDGPIKKKVKKNPLNTYENNLPKSIRDYLKFTKWFSEELPSLSTSSKYYSKRNKKYRVHLFDKILGPNGESTTPARIHKNQHFIEVSKSKFMEYTVPMRAFIMCHEFAHVYLNKDPRNEVEADVNGMKLYMAMGFPVIECMYSFTKVFGESPETLERSKNAYKILKEEENRRK